MPAHLRVSVPDRPGALAALTTALSRIGTNVLSVVVVDREQGRAVDDLILDWPYERPTDMLIVAVEHCAGTRVHGLRHLLAPAQSSDADLVAQVLDAPHRAIEIVADGLPAVLLADWCAVFDRRDQTDVAYATPTAPHPLPPSAGPLDRALTGHHDAETYVVSELPGTALRVMVGRANGPPFTRAEADRCAALLRVAADVVRLAYRPTSATTATEVTQQVLDPVVERSA